MRSRSPWHNLILRPSSCVFDKYSATLIKCADNGQALAVLRSLYASALYMAELIGTHRAAHFDLPHLSVKLSTLARNATQPTIICTRLLATLHSYRLPIRRITNLSALIHLIIVLTIWNRNTAREGRPGLSGSKKLFGFKPSTIYLT